MVTTNINMSNPFCLYRSTDHFVLFPIRVSRIQRRHLLYVLPSILLLLHSRVLGISACDSTNIYLTHTHTHNAWRTTTKSTHKPHTRTYKKTTHRHSFTHTGVDVRRRPWDTAVLARRPRVPQGDAVLVSGRHVADRQPQQCAAGGRVAGRVERVLLQL